MAAQFGYGDVPGFLHQLHIDIEPAWPLMRRLDIVIVTFALVLSGIGVGRLANFDNANNARHFTV